MSEIVTDFIKPTTIFIITDGKYVDNFNSFL